MKCETEIQVKIHVLRFLFCSVYNVPQSRRLLMRPSTVHCYKTMIYCENKGCNMIFLYWQILINTGVNRIIREIEINIGNELGLLSSVNTLQN